MARKRLARRSSSASLAALVAMGLLALPGCSDSTPAPMDGGTDTAVEMDSSMMDMDSSVECDEGKYGATCTETCDCGHGVCDDGRAGTGTCTCDNGFTGPACDACATGYFGATCTGVCDCANGTCDEGVNGTGACSCSVNWTGATCDDCEDGRYGETCTEECGTCLAGTCNDGVAGTGTCDCNEHASGTTCDTCQAGFYGEDCASECTCLNGSCDEGIGGDGSCQCNDGWIGASCDVRARSCLEIHNNNPAAPSGVYEVKPDNGAPLNVYCDMTEVGGGWMLVLNYVHAGGTNPVFAIRGTAGQLTTPPFLGPGVLGDSEANSPNEATAPYWGHTSRALLNRFSFSELRFYAVSSGTHTTMDVNSPNRVIHFIAAAPNCNNYFRTGGGSCSDLVNTWTPLPDHTGELLISPQGSPWNLATSGLLFGSGRSDEAMTFEPFHIDNGIGWALRVQTSRWEADDACFNYAGGCGTDSNKSARSTIHRIWVR